MCGVVSFSKRQECTTRDGGQALLKLVCTSHDSPLPLPFTWHTGRIPWSGVAFGLLRQPGELDQDACRRSGQSGQGPKPANGPRGTSSLDVSQKCPMRAEMNLVPSRFACHSPPSVSSTFLSFTAKHRSARADTPSTVDSSCIRSLIARRLQSFPV